MVNKYSLAAFFCFFVAVVFVRSGAQKQRCAVYAQVFIRFFSNCDFHIPFMDYVCRLVCFGFSFVRRMFVPTQSNRSPERDCHRLAVLSRRATTSARDRKHKEARSSRQETITLTSNNNQRKLLIMEQTNKRKICSAFQSNAKQKCKR